MIREGLAFLALAGIILAPVAREAAKPTAAKVAEKDRPVVREVDTPVQDTRPHCYRIGEFELTAYCACSECCGKSVWDPAYGITASGTTVQEGRTIAVDPDVIPLGSVVYVQQGTQVTRYIAEDTGEAIQGNRLDIYFDSHDKALEFGVQDATVYVFK